MRNTSKDAMPRTARSRIRSIVAGAVATALVATGATVVTAAAPPAPAQAAYPDTFNPFAMNGGFTVYAREDLTMGNDETEGSLAAGGVATKPGDGQYTIIHVAAGTADYTLPTVDGDPTRLLVGEYSPGSGGILAITSAGTSDPSLQGDLKMVQRDGPFQAFTRADWLRLNTNPANPDQRPLIDATAQVYPEDAAPPASAAGDGSIYTADTSATAVADYVEANRQADYDQAAACLDEIADPTLDLGYPVGVAEDAGSRKVLEPLSADRPNVVDYSEIAGAALLQFSAGPTPGAANPLIIRVPAGTTDVVGLRIDPQGTYSPYTFWDLSALTGDVSVTAAEGRIDGSIYAPNANVTVDAAPLDGQVIGQNVVLEGGEVHSFLFAGEIACAADSGSFRVHKALEGIAEDDLPAGTTFTVSWTATEPDGTELTGSLDVPADGGWADPGEQFPIGTEIVFDEIAPPSVPGYEWGSPTIAPDSITVGTGTADIVVTNTATALVGTFEVTKSVQTTDGSTPAPPAGTVPVTWTASFGGEQIAEGTLEVPLDGTPAPVGQDFPVGTEISLDEDLSGVTPPPGYDWTGASWDPSATFEIDDTSTVAVSLVNLLTPESADRTVTLVKSASGDAADDRFGYEVSYNTDPAGERTTRDLPVGDPETLDDLETDADAIALAELVPTLDGSPTDADAWELPTFTVTTDDGEPQTFTPENFEGAGPLDGAIVEIPIAESGDIVIEISNTLQEGTFALSKAFAGIDGANLPATIGFAVAWTAQTPLGDVVTGTVRLPADGTAVSPLDDEGQPVTFPVGTEVTFVEQTPPGVGWIDWGDPVVSPEPLVVVGDDEPVATATLTNSATLRTSTFQVVKRFAGIDPGDVLAGSFTVEYTAHQPFAGIATGSIEVPADGTPAGPTVDGEPVQFPVGTVVRLAEVEPDASALPPNYAWAEATWNPSAFLLVRPGVVAERELVNSVSELARFSVEKAVSGDATDLVPADTTFPVEWWLGLQSQDPLNAGIGAPAVSPYLPVGSTVELREGDLPEIDGVEWGAVSWTAAGEPVPTTPGGLVALRVDGDPEPLALVMTNTASAEPAGGFTVTKTLTGGAASEVPTDTAFTIEYIVDDGEAQTSQVAAGETVEVVDVPAGATVRLRELAPPSVEGVAWGAATWSIDGEELTPDADGWVTTTVDAGATLAFSLVNTAAPGALPVTGGSGVIPLLPVLAVIAVAIGAGLVVRRRMA